MKIKQIPFILSILMLTVLCGYQQPKTPASDNAGMPLTFAPLADTPISQQINDVISKKILALPEMQFPNAAVMIVDEPTADQPWYTVKAGSNMDDHFTTSFWFRVYSAPEYKIRIYDIVSDSEMTLAAWRGSKPVFDEVWEDEQRRIANQCIQLLKSKGFRVVTAVTKATVFYPAETYHQDYYFRNGKVPYCHSYVKRF